MRRRPVTLFFWFWSESLRFGLRFIRLLFHWWRTDLSPIEALELLLLTETLRLLISFSNIICGIHLEKVKPTLSTLVLEVMWAYLNYSLISIRITPSVTSSVHIFSHLLLLLLDVLFLPDFALTQAASLLYVLNISTIILPLRAMIIAHRRRLFV